MDKEGYWQGYQRGYRDAQQDIKNGEPGMRLDFYAPFIEGGVEYPDYAPPIWQPLFWIYRSGS